MLSIRTVFHLTDSSKGASFGLSLACSLASDHNARLIVVSLAQPLTLVAYEFPEATMPFSRRREELWDDSGRPSERRLQMQTVRHLAGPDDLVPQVLRLIQKLGCDLIIVGMEESSSEARVRNLTDQLLRRARCPVLIARCPHKERLRLTESQTREFVEAL
jgi:nucleotide-binding universal stress UspA family protein